MATKPSEDAMNMAAWHLERHAEALRHVAVWLRSQAKPSAGSARVSPPVVKANLPRLMTVADVASATGTPIGTIRHWITTGRLQSVRPGRKRMVYMDSLEALLRSGETV